MRAIKKKASASNSHFTRAKRRELLDGNRQVTVEVYQSPKPNKKTKRGRRDSTVVPLTSKSLHRRDSMSEEEFEGFNANLPRGRQEVMDFSTGSGQQMFGPSNRNTSDTNQDRPRHSLPSNNPRGAVSNDPTPTNIQTLVQDITNSVQKESLKFIAETQQGVLEAMKKDLQETISSMFRNLQVNIPPGLPNMTVPPPNMNVGHNAQPQARNGSNANNRSFNSEYELRYRDQSQGNGVDNVLNGSRNMGNGNPNNNGNGHHNYPRNNQGLSDRNANTVTNDKVKMETWGIKYDGSNMTFESFIFRVDSMKQASCYSSKQVFDNFHKLLSGESLISWYWGYRQGHQRATYDEFKAALNQEWGSRETDIEIWRKMLSRRQKPNESFDKFWEDMRAMSYRLKYTPDSVDLIGLIRGNVLPEIELSLVADKTVSLSDFIKACRAADDVLKKSTNVYGKTFGFRKTVNEIEVEQEVHVEEIKRGFRPSKTPINFNGSENSQEPYKNCWNCNEEHRFRDCIYEIKGVFCFRCGRRGVIAPKCKCQENRQ